MTDITRELVDDLLAAVSLYMGNGPDGMAVADALTALLARAERAEADLAAIAAVTLERAAQVAESAGEIALGGDYGAGVTATAHQIAEAIRAMSPEPPHVAAARFVVVNIGCLECVVSSDIVGTYATEAEAARVAEVLGDKLEWRDGWQNAYEVFDLHKPTADEYLAALEGETT
jgi:hypothetical protein